MQSNTFIWHIPCSIYRLKARKKGKKGEQNGKAD
jgi:hypothetical protein